MTKQKLTKRIKNDTNKLKKKEVGNNDGEEQSQSREKGKAQNVDRLVYSKDQNQERKRRKPEKEI